MYQEVSSCTWREMRFIPPQALSKLDPLLDVLQEVDKTLAVLDADDSRKGLTWSRRISLGRW